MTSHPFESPTERGNPGCIASKNGFSPMRFVAGSVRIFLFCALFNPLLVCGAWDEPSQDYDHVAHRRLLVQFETNGNSIHWFDNTHLILSVRMLGDWTAGPTDLARIVLLDTETGAVSDTPYRGDLICFAPERMVVREHPNSNGYFHVPSTANIDFIKQRHTAGKYGERLEPIDARAASLSTLPFCGERPIKDPAFSPGVRQIKDGYVSQGSSGGSKFYDKSKTLIYSSTEPFIGLYIQYVRPLDLYFNQSHRKPATSLARLFDAKGNTRETYPYPGILWHWIDEVSGTAANAWTQAGLIWEVSVGSRDERNGLYLQARDGRFIKFYHTWIQDMKMSPDGCRLPILETKRSFSLFGLGAGAYHDSFTIYNFCAKE